MSVLRGYQRITEAALLIPPSELKKLREDQARDPNGEFAGGSGDKDDSGPHGDAMGHILSAMVSSVRVIRRWVSRRRRITYRPRGTRYPPGTHLRAGCSPRPCIIEMAARRRPCRCLVMPAA
jgi:hypothetical protein